VGQLSAAQAALASLSAAVPGVLQGMLVMEDIVERVALAVGRPVEEVKRLNMYQAGRCATAS
jgi:xanthine dehydrogenase molybdopterin-binding subunit B